MTNRAVLRFPDRKISQTLLDFAAPIMHDLPSEAPEHRARQALEVSFTVWNAVIFADWLNDHRYLDQIRHLTAGKPETGLLVEQMIARKRELFADDERLIGDWEVTRTEDGINVRADARDPFSLPRHPNARAKVKTAQARRRQGQAWLSEQTFQGLANHITQHEPRARLAQKELKERAELLWKEVGFRALKNGIEESAAVSIANQDVGRNWAERLAKSLSGDLDRISAAVTETAVKIVVKPP